MTISQCRHVNMATYDRICNGLAHFGFTFRQQPEGMLIHGGRKKALRFWMLTAPVLSYKLDRVVLQGRFRTPDKVVSVEPAGISEVVSLTTTTGNYIAAGHASKNCAAQQKDIGRRVVWDFTGANNLQELNTKLRERGYVRRLKADVIKDLPSNRQIR